MADSLLFHITFPRHGELVGNLESWLQGHSDFPLTKTGSEQTRALSVRWQSESFAFDRAFSSPLLRTQKIAEIVCAALNVPLELDPSRKDN